MFDGSTLPLDENLRMASALLARCSELDVVLEIESGVVGGEEDGMLVPRAGAMSCTPPQTICVVSPRELD